MERYGTSTQFVICVTLMGLTAGYLAWRFTPDAHFTADQDHNGIKSEIANSIWDKYTNFQVDGKAPNQSLRFFQAIPKTHKEFFNSSKNKKIVQLGVSSGLFLKNNRATAHKQLIGYDYTVSSRRRAEHNGIEFRLVDLNKNNGKSLAYQKLLEKDLDNSSDILLIRIFEYLDGKAAILLLKTLLDIAKPGSNFFFETTVPTTKNPLGNNHKIGDISHLFRNHKDIKVLYHSVGHELGDANRGDTEQLIARKTGKP